MKILLLRMRIIIFNTDIAKRTCLHDERIPEVEYSIFQHFRVSRRSGPSTIVDPKLLVHVNSCEHSTCFVIDTSLPNWDNELLVQT